MLAERLVDQPRPFGEFAIREHNLDPLVPENPEATTVRVLGRIVAGDDDPPDAGLADRLGAWRCAPLVAARLERDVERRPGEIMTPGIADRLHLGVRRAERRVIALAERPAVDRDHGADERIGRNAAGAVLGELDRPRQVACVGVGLERHTDSIGRRRADACATRSSSQTRAPARCTTIRPP